MLDQRLVVDVPGWQKLQLRHVVLDFNGTLARDGSIPTPVRRLLKRLSQLLPLTVLTADTFGTARCELKKLPVQLEIIQTGLDKARFVSARRGVVVIGNGRNDVAMMKSADLAVAVMGPEGTAAAALRAAHVVVRELSDALELLLYPHRLIATLRR